MNPERLDRAEVVLQVGLSRMRLRGVINSVMVAQLLLVLVFCAGIWGSGLVWGVPYTTFLSTSSVILFALALVPLAAGILVLVLSLWLVNRFLGDYEKRLQVHRAKSRDIASLQYSLEASKADLNRVQTLAKVGSWVYDFPGDVLKLSAQACQMLSLPEGSTISRLQFQSFIFAGDRGAVEAAWQGALGGGGFDVQYCIVVEAQERWVHQTAEVEFLEDGTPMRAVGVIQDITERARVEAEMRKNERYQRALLDNFPFGVWLKDKQSNFLSVNAELARWSGATSAHEIVGKNDHDLWPNELADAYRADDLVVLETRQAKHVEEPIATKDGKRWFETYKAPVIDEHGVVLGTVGFARDITERKMAEEAINILAFYDTLTSLPNRRLLIDRLKHALASSQRKHQHGALLFIDLDNFKTLNDTCGHDIGDLLLKQVAQRLVGCVRQHDTVARLGGDEFVVMLEDLSESPQEAASETEAVANKILVALNQVFEIFHQQHHSTPSIGATLFANQEGSIEELLKRADLAMYQAKAAGRNTLRFFDPEMQAAVSNRAEMEAGLREALRQQQFVVHFQPQVNRIGQIIGAEVLVRWLHPRRGIVLPGEFIALAENCNLIQPLGLWVLQSACTQLVDWANVPGLADIKLSVNVSARQIGQHNFVDQVLAVLSETGANPRRLMLELTETLLVANVDETIAKMQALKAHGVHFSLDDFGTGYSSLLYLKRMPLDQLKIDQSFVRDVLVDPNDTAIAKTVVALANNLGLGVIAEGVETPDQQAFLHSIGCFECQGYLYSRPLPITAFEAFAKSRLSEVWVP